MKDYKKMNRKYGLLVVVFIIAFILILTVLGSANESLYWLLIFLFIIIPCIVLTLCLIIPMIINLLKEKCGSRNVSVDYWYDKLDWQVDSATNEYCDEKGLSVDNLTDNDYMEIERYAGNHLGFLITWLIRNDFLSDVHDKNITNKVKCGEMLGVDYVIKSLRDNIPRGLPRKMIVV